MSINKAMHGTIEEVCNLLLTYIRMPRFYRSIFKKKYYCIKAIYCSYNVDL